MRNEASMAVHPDDCRENPVMEEAAVTSRAAWLRYLLAGTVFGFIAIRSEIIAWYRIQEMFRFDAFHMYGVIGSAVLVAFVSLRVMRAVGATALDGSRIDYPVKEPGVSRYLLGGTAFGLGWGLVGACPGPILALIGAGMPAFLVVLFGALLGTLTYGALRRFLPHA